MLAFELAELVTRKQPRHTIVLDRHRARAVRLAEERQLATRGTGGNDLEETALVEGVLGAEAPLFANVEAVWAVAARVPDGAGGEFRAREGGGDEGPEGSV